jgi:hypothetical protein
MRFLEALLEGQHLIHSTEAMLRLSRLDAEEAPFRLDRQVVALDCSLMLLTTSMSPSVT